MSGLPTGTVTFLLTDIEGSTRLWQEHPVSMGDAVARHAELIRERVEGRGGTLLKSRGEGDGTFSAFARASDAVAAALDVQRALAAQSDKPRLRVRIGVHTGEAEVRDGDYLGAAVARCARLRDAARGGQTLLSQTSAGLVAPAMPSGARLEDLGLRRLRDLAGTEHIFELCHPDVPRVARAHPSDALPHNLRAELTTFVGRDAELAEVSRLLVSTRLVTLVGPGGVGKSRLAARVAAAAIDRHADGVWAVDVDSVSDPALLAEAAAEAVGARELARADPGPGAEPMSALGRLVESLRARRVLLVLDGCERVVAAAAELVTTLLRSCPSLTVLATSREPLSVPGEARWRVPPLEPADAARLFVERARLHERDFAVTAENEDALTSICARLDGLPLAIELAASWVRALEPAEIAARLENRLLLPAGGDRGEVARHRTLRAAVDWSADLLSEAERLLLCRLWVFKSGFTLRAAERVCSDETIEQRDVLALLSRLVDTSLVVKDSHAGAARYRLLDTIRQYSRERFDELDGSVQPPRRAPDGELTLVFARQGEYWTVGRPGEVVRVRDTKGMGYLHVLLSAPGREVHVLDLVGAAATSADDGELLDPQARAAYRRRLAELEEELEEARAWDDAARQSRAREEIDRLAAELADAIGLGGRGRRAPAPVERARVAATKAIRTAIERIASADPEVADELAATISTGAFCSYAPDSRRPVRWTLSPNAGVTSTAGAP